MRRTEPPSIDENGVESHPAFGMAMFNRTSGGNSTLFDSDITHFRVVTFRVERARRKRMLSRDWITPGKTLFEIQMSEAQFGALVSSFGSSGVPVTITHIETDWDIPGIDSLPRFAENMAEIRGAAQEQVDRASDAMASMRAALYPENKRPKIGLIKKAFQQIEIVLGNLPLNLEYTSRQMTEHVENVVTKAKADIEAMVDARAREHGLPELADSVPLPALETGDADGGD